MRYRVVKRLGFGWVVQLWCDCEWVDISRLYLRESEALRVKDVLES